MTMIDPYVSEALDKQDRPTPANPDKANDLIACQDGVSAIARKTVQGIQDFCRPPVRYGHLHEDCSPPAAGDGRDRSTAALLDVSFWPRVVSRRDGKPHGTGMVSPSSLQGMKSEGFTYFPTFDMDVGIDPSETPYRTLTARHISPPTGGVYSHFTIQSPADPMSLFAHCADCDPEHTPSPSPTSFCCASILDTELTALDPPLPMIMLTDPNENATTIYEPHKYPQLLPTLQDLHHLHGLNKPCFQESSQQSKSNTNEQQTHVRNTLGLVDVEQGRDSMKLPLWLNTEGKLVIKVSALQRKKNLEGAASSPAPKPFACDVKSHSAERTKRKSARSNDPLKSGKRRKTSHPTDHHDFNLEGLGVALILDAIHQETEVDQLVMSFDHLTLSST